MRPSSDRPAIILGCANSYQEPGRQAHLVRERQTIAHILRQTNEVQSPELVAEDPEAGQYIFDQLRAQHFSTQAAVLHLAGYSEGQYLHLQGGLGEEPISAEGVAQLISRLSGLRLVFLNGCATPELVRQLLRRDIPAVLALQASQRRMQHSPLAFSFYEAISQGRSLRSAFQQLQRATPETLSYRPVSYDLERDDFLAGERWLGELSETELPGGLYVQVDREAELDWALPPHESASPSDLIERMVAPSMGKRISLGLLLAALLVLLGVFSGML